MPAQRLLLVCALALSSLACSHRAVRPTAHVPGDGAFHTVQAGDTLSSLARALGSSRDAIARENALDDPDRLEVGRVLWVPRVTRAQAPSDAQSDADARGTSTKAADSGAADARSSDARARSATRRGGALSSESTLADRRPGARLLWPVHGVLISRFGDRHGEHHEGIDLAAPEGTHIVAAAPGTVVFVGEQRGYGQLVLVAHGGDLVTVYAHNEENLVTVGQKVDRGQALARVGRTGNASGPHLHFEVRADAHAVDPLPYLR